MGPPEPERAPGRRRGPGAWRQRVRSNPATAALYRIAVGVTGTLVVLLGIVLIPLPGPGWLTVFIGLSILGSEFRWAQQLNQYARRRVTSWTLWISRQPRLSQALIGASGLGLLLLVAVTLAVWQGYLPSPRSSVTSLD